MPAKLKPPTKAEDVAIQAGIAADPDNPEWTEDDFTQARPAAEMLPRLMRGRGAQRTPTKQLISLRIDQDLLDRLRATGPGWQARVNALLRKALLG